MTFLASAFKNRLFVSFSDSKLLSVVFAAFQF